MTIAPLDLILLLGSLQGLILATLLWVNNKGRQLANRLLACLIGSLALMSFAVGVPITGRWISLAIDLLPFFLVMPIGPLIYFYTRSVLDPTFHVDKAERRHFYLIILDVGAPIIGWTYISGVFLGLLPPKNGSSWGHVMDEYNTYVDIPRWISVTVYLFLTKNWLKTYTDESASAAHQKRWLGQFVNGFLIFQSIWLLFMIPYIIPSLRDPLLDRLGWYPVYIPISILIYWLGLRGYLQTRSEPPAQVSTKSPATELSVQTVQQVTDALAKAMNQDRLYLDPELTTDKLGLHLQLNAKLMSAVLNQHIGKNFNAYINEYRIDEVKRRLLDTTYEHLTLTGIAFDCGFNSQATFQRTFKQVTGTSPREFVAQHRNKTSQIGI